MNKFLIILALSFFIAFECFANVTITQITSCGRNDGIGSIVVISTSDGHRTLMTTDSTDSLSLPRGLFNTHLNISMAAYMSGKSVTITASTTASGVGGNWCGIGSSHRLTPNENGSITINPS